MPVTATTALGLRGWSWRRRLPVIVLAVAAITLLELRVVVTIAHSRHTVYQLPTAAVITVVAAGAIGTLAAVGMTLIPRPRVAVLAAVIAGLAVAGLATVLSIGLLLLPVAIVAGFAIAPALRGTGSRGWALGLLCGVPLGAGLVAVSIVSVQPPLVRCGQGTVDVSDRAWWGGGTGTTSSVAWLQPGGGDGRLTSGGQTYRYACRGRTLVSFEKS
jgi:hypothetical protein